MTALRVSKLRVYLSCLARSDTPTQILCMPPVLRTVQKAAEDIFKWKLPKLTAVVFVVDGERALQMKVRTFAFLRSKEGDSTGNERFAAIPIEPHMVKHHVPCADILQDEKFVFA
jgi:hypothetical protein